jgi:hypothetical protein
VITYDLRCSSAHIFEGWFGSSADYDKQHAGGLIICPICGDGLITKALSAPFIGRKSNQRVQSKSVQDAEPYSGPKADSTLHEEQSAPPLTNAPQIPEAMTQLMEKMAAVQKDVLKDSQWVGRKFADEARAIHYGEVQARQIHGEASPQEAQSLADEGVGIAALPFPILPPEAKN